MSKQAPGNNVRTQATRALIATVYDHLSLDDAILEHSQALSTKDKSLMQAMCYGVMRWQLQLMAWLEELSNRPPAKLERPVLILILLGLQQLAHMRTPAHAAIHATVESATRLKCAHAKGMINAVLRNFQRRQQELSALINENPVTRYAHPRWMLEILKQDWPADWPSIATANNEQAPMTLRLDSRRTSRVDYLQQLSVQDLAAEPHPIAPDAVTLSSPVEVEQLPEFGSGLVSIQDAAAQLAAPLLDHDNTHRVLDACAAPGGKTAHILQLNPPRHTDALDVSSHRLGKLHQLLKRINKTIRVIEGDAANPGDWWDGELYDRILLDAPCSATGVIRRHPDIKHHRNTQSVKNIVRRQKQILDALWPLLRPGGIMLYVTCSVFKMENEQQISAFISRQSDASLLPIPGDWGRGDTGKQILPGELGMDGFYFARLVKR